MTDERGTREIIPLVELAGGNVQLVYSNNAPDGYGFMIDAYALKAAMQFGKTLTLKRFDAHGIHTVRKAKPREV